MDENATRAWPRRSAPHRSFARHGGDEGVAEPIEMLFLFMFALGFMVFLGYLGRMNSAATSLSSASRAAARAASLGAGPSDGEAQAQSLLSRTSLAVPCHGRPDLTFTWAPSREGSWYGGSATVTLRCTIANQSLTGVLVPGDRTIVARATEVIDAFQPAATP